MNYVIDFFCGAGGASLGFRQAGAHIIAGIDHEEIYSKTYSQILNKDGSNAKFIAADLFPSSDAHPSGQLDYVREHIEELIDQINLRRGFDRLIFIICSPCQPFSSMKGRLTPARAKQRERDKQLLLSTLSLVDEFHPDMIFMENVAGIDRGSPENPSVLQLGFDFLESKNYSSKSVLINACDFGVAQSRNRQISISLHNSYDFSFDLPEKDIMQTHYTTVASVLSRFPAITAGQIHQNIPNHIARDLSPINLKRLASVQPGESNHVLADSKYGDLSLKCHRDLAERTNGKNTYSDTYTRMHPDGIAPTITTNCVSVSNGRFGHYDMKQNRAISVREAAALQSFPDDFIFYPTETLHPAARMVGNAVPPKLAHYFGEFLFKRLGFL